MQIRALPLFCLSAGFVALASLAFIQKPATVKAATTPAVYTPTYTAAGDLIPPLDYRNWVYLTTGFNMSYTPKTASDGSPMQMFDNVFVNPEAYRSFLETGTWPDKTVMVLEGREAASKGSINKSGNFQSGGVMGLEIHVRDEKRFPGKWAFFDVESETRATLFPQTANCYSCHAEHAAVDTTFVQFYPTLLPIAQKKNTLSPRYLKDVADDSAK